MNENKKILRASLIQRLEGLEADYLKESSQTICRRLMGLEAYQKAEAVFCFVGVGREIDTRPILEDCLKRGVRLAVPRCYGQGMMKALEIHSLEELHPAPFGLLEPRDTALEVMPESIEFAVIPCLAAASSGYRLGWGAGYYDRYLAGTHFPKALLCREIMLMEAIPVESHDVPIETLVTERAVAAIAIDKKSGNG